MAFDVFAIAHDVFHPDATVIVKVRKRFGSGRKRQAFGGAGVGIGRVATVAVVARHQIVFAIRLHQTDLWVLIISVVCN